jgi:hypothetical protein
MLNENLTEASVSHAKTVLARTGMVQPGVCYFVSSPTPGAQPGIPNTTRRFRARERISVP